MSVFQPGRNVWRIERAARASVLIDAGAFFGAVREALLQAERNVFIIGWDLDSRTRLVGEDCATHDGWPATLREFLIRLVEERPALTVYLLAWDYAVLYALEREPFPSLKLGWNTPERVRFRLDNAVPVGSSQHQKIIVVDDALAFSGGLDLTIRRWDTCQHEIADPHRLDPSGQPYRPFHDVQMMVDGDAALALAELARERWERVTDEQIPLAPAGSPWPESVSPDVRDSDIAIARTLPEYDGEGEVREAEVLFHDMVARAERSIYIENQFVTSASFAKTLAAQLRERPALEAVIVAPRSYDSWVESHTMRNGRIRFANILQEAGVADRVGLLYPDVRDGGHVTDTMVHSKVMIIDDRWLRVGSANLNNRSMGTDSECDLALEAHSVDQRRAVQTVRARLLADHCGTTEMQAAKAIEVQGLLRAAETLSARGHSLRPIDDGAPDAGELAEYIEAVADPDRPVQSKALLADLVTQRVPGRRWPVFVKLAAIAALFAGLTIAWHYPPLSEIARPDSIGPMLQSLAAEPWAPILVIGIYLVGGLIAFPVLILIAATAAAFGPVAGLLYATTGALASAIVTYAVGALLGRETLRGVIGPRLRRVQRKIVNGGVLAIAAIRMVPLAPFTVVNLVAGASEIRLGAYVAGTLIGMAPGLILMSALGHQFVRVLSEPKLIDFALLAAFILVWLAFAGGVQLLITRFGSRA